MRRYPQAPTNIGPNTKQGASGSWSWWSLMMSQYYQEWPQDDMINMLIIWSILWYCDHWCDQNQDILSPTYKSRLTARTAAWTATWADVCYHTLHFTFCILRFAFFNALYYSMYIYKYWIFVIFKTFDENPTVCHLFFHQLKFLRSKVVQTRPSKFSDYRLFFLRSVVQWLENTNPQKISDIWPEIVILREQPFLTYLLSFS